MKRKLKRIFIYSSIYIIACNLFQCCVYYHFLFQDHTDLITPVSREFSSAPKRCKLSLISESPSQQGDEEETGDLATLCRSIKKTNSVSMDNQDTI